MSTLLGLTDTPNSFVGQNGKFVRVSGNETTLEFENIPTPTPDCLKYIAELSQSGDMFGEVQARVLLNTVGLDISWLRISEGVYTGGAIGLFSPQTRLIITNFTSNKRFISVEKIDTNTITISSFDFSGTPVDGLRNVYIEIQIYP